MRRRCKCGARLCALVRVSRGDGRARLYCWLCGRRVTDPRSHGWRLRLAGVRAPARVEDAR